MVGRVDADRLVRPTVYHAIGLLVAGNPQSAKEHGVLFDRSL